MFNGDEEDPYFIVTHKEQEMLKQLRGLSEENRKEVIRRFLEIALKYAEWGIAFYNLCVSMYRLKFSYTSRSSEDVKKALRL